MIRWPFAARRGLDHTALTDTGLRRKENEDSVLVMAPDHGKWGFDLAAVVCDGVGGQPQGETASRLAVDAFRATLSQPDRRPMRDRLTVAGAAASAAIADFARREAGGAALATTVVAVVVSGRTVTVGHAGDSRAYLLRGGALKVLTRDHTFVAEQVRQGLIPESAARGHPLRSRISRALGTPGADAIETSEVAGAAADVFLLCSDGLHAFVDEAEIAKAIDHDLHSSAKRLIALANAAGGVDNVTVALCRLP